MTLKLNPYFLNSRTPKLPFGGKGLSLRGLSKTGARVPKTFLFDSAEVQQQVELKIPFYREKIAQIGLWKFIRKNHEPEALAALRQDLLSLPMPQDWLQKAAAISSTLSASGKKCSSALIIRSSMNIEDHSSHSLAGAFDSKVILDGSAKNLWNGLLEVLSSAFKFSAVVRILEAGISLQDLQLGFLIQEWVPSRCGGVCFSHHPIDPWDENGLIEWGGTAESVVQGKGLVQTARRNDCPPKTLQNFWEELWRITAKWNTILKSPVDLEWVWDGVKLWVVQVRPVATQEARLVGRTRNGQRWSRELTQERFPEALTPMGWSALEDVFAANLRILNSEFGIIVKHPEEAGFSLHGTVYANPELFQLPGGIRIRWLSYLAPWKKSFWRLLKVAGAIGYHRIRYNHLDLPPDLKKAWTALKWIDALLGEKADLEIRKWPSHLDHCLKEIELFNRRIQNKTSDRIPVLLQEMEELRDLSISFLESDISIYLMKDALFKGLKGLWMALGNQEMDFPILVDHFENNRTLQINDALTDFCSQLQKEPQSHVFIEKLKIARHLQDALAASTVMTPKARECWRRFLDKNGHVRTTWDIAFPCWRESPSQIGLLLSAYLVNAGSAKESLRKTPGAAPTRGASTLTDPTKLAHSNFFNQLQKKGLGSSIPLIQNSLHRLKQLMSMDEEQHFLSGILMEPSRFLIHKGEKMLIHQGILRDPGHVFFLTLTELKEALAKPFSDLSFLTRRREAEWKRHRSERKPLILPSRSSHTSSAAYGRPASSGQATGPIHFLEHLQDIQGIPKGAILVTTSPNPSFAPIYPLLAGMITVTGGMLSHGFVAAREYGLPAISGVHDALERFRPGMTVKIDGNRGTVEILI